MEILLVGDIVTTTRVQNGITYKHIDYSISDEIKRIFEDADFVIGNLEQTITDSTDYEKNKQVVYKVPLDKTHIVRHFNYLNIANNHILDYKERGMTDTIDYLDRNGIYWSGTNVKKYVVVNVGNKKIAIISATDHPRKWSDKIHYINETNYHNLQKIVNEIGTVDLVIFSYHYGSNYKDNVKQYERMMRTILSFGIDIIHGHSAHHLNKISTINKKGKNKYIIYSNGDFINDYGWKSREKEKYKMNYSCIVKLVLTKNNVYLSIIPTKIEYTFAKNYYANVESSIVKMAYGKDRDIVYDLVK